MISKKSKLQFTLEDCEILTLFDKKKRKSRQFIIIENNNLLLKLIALDNRQEVYLKTTTLNSKEYIHSTTQRQILRIWNSKRFKPKQFLAINFKQIVMSDPARLVFFSETISGERQLIDNGEFWNFSEYGQPFIFCGHLACPVRINTDYWSIAVEKIRHFKFKSNEMSINIRVDDNTQLLSFRHPDNLSGWVTIPLADYGLKPVE